MIKYAQSYFSNTQTLQYYMKTTHFHFRFHSFCINLRFATIFFLMKCQLLFGPHNFQVYEMFLAGYQFHVLSPIFTIHWGLQHKKSRPPWRESQNTKNMKKFKEFKRELLVKYKRNPSKKPAPDVGFAFGMGKILRGELSNVLMKP